MRHKRMFSMSILDSDAFLEMPQSTQNLYMHMAMRADDDGFLGNPKRIIRMVGAGDDDYKILLGKRFLLVFDDGICVIKHWLIHNTIRKDRYEETVYKDQKKLLNIKENKAYSLGEPNGNQMATSGCHSIEEKSIEEKSIETKKSSLSLLEKLPTEIKTALSEKYYIDPAGIQSKATDLFLYCKQKGKVYKDYKALLENAIRKDKLKLQNQYPAKTVPNSTKVENLTPEQIEANKARIEKIRNGLVNKFKT